MSEAPSGSEPTAAPDGGLVADSGRIAIAAALSRASGFARIVIAASVLGSTVLGDLFVAVNVLPLVLFDVFAGSAISSVLVPPLVALLDRGEEGRARRLAANALGVVGAAMLAVAVVALVGRGWIGRGLASGVEAALADDGVRVAALLIGLIAPQIVLYAAIGVFVSIQHAHRRFLLPSSAPIIENLGLMATIGVVAIVYGGGIEVDESPLGLILLLGLGSGLSVAGHAVTQYIGARRAAGGVGLSFDHHDPALRSLAGPTRASFGWSSVIALRQFALIVAAGFAGAGGVQAFEIAMLAYFIPVALIGRPVASAALPRLSRAATEPARVLAGYRNALRLVGWLAIPAGAALVLLSRPLADVVARGRFDGPEATTLVVLSLVGLGVGATADALFEVARQASMARRQGHGLRRSTAVRAVVTLIGLPATVLMLDGPMVLLGLGLVVSVGDAAALTTAHRALRADPAWAPGEDRHWPRIALASAVALGPVALLDSTSFLDGVGDSARLVAVVLSVLALYAAAAYVTSDRGRLFRTVAAFSQLEATG